MIRTPLAAALVAALSVLAARAPAQAAAKVPAPEDVIGFKPGADGMLAGYGKILEYFTKLADASDRVDLRLVGKTTEGRDMALALISSPENLRRIDVIREDNLRLADPRKIGAGETDALVARGKVIVLVNESIHSNEVGPAQAGMTTAHWLATTNDPEWRKVLNDVVILLNPCHNPDGYDAVTGWWNRFKDDPKTRGAPLPVLYHKYVGHDNNRDWFMLTQAESRVTVQEMHLEWRPQIVVDQHQMGAAGPRMFIPPYQEPWEPNVHPLLRKQLEGLGRSVMAAMTAQGLKGVVCNRMFDAWSPSRAYMHYHGGVRVLTEVASCQTADPIENAGGRGGGRGGRGESSRSEDEPAPWTGGRWALGDIVTYCRTAVLEAVRHASKHRSAWLRNFHAVHADACEAKAGPRGFLVPMDQPRRAALRKLMDILTLGAVEMELTAEPFVVEGRTYSAGSLFIRAAQPYFPFARALFEIVPYPEIRARPDGPIRRPYDVTAHNLPLLLDLEVVPVPRGPLPKVLDRPASAALLEVNDQVGGEILLDARDEGAHLDALAALAQGIPVERVDGEVGSLPAGGFIVRSKDGRAKLRHAKAHMLPKDVKGRPLRAPRIGVYWSWMASMDEGWTRFFFDMLGVPFTPLRNADLRAGKLAEKVDVVVVASLGRAAILEGQRSEKLPEENRGGIGDEGEAALRAFVEGGGTLVTLNDSSALAIDLFKLPLETVPAGGRQVFDRERDREGGGEARGEADPGAGRAAARFDVPGALLWADVDPAHELVSGCPPRLALFNQNDRGFRLKADAGARSDISMPVRYSASKVSACGFAEGVESLSGAGAIADVKVGRGRAVLFAFSPQFRCQTWSSFRLLLNCLHPRVQAP